MLLTADFYLDIFSSQPTYLAPKPILVTAPAFAPVATLESKNMSSNPVLTTAEAINPLINKLNPQGLKPCCACPDTKKLRDDCFLQFGSNVDEDGESATKCKAIVQNHLKCMRSLGFNV